MNRNYYFTLILSMLLGSCSKTSTPKEFINKKTVPLQIYKKDKKHLEKLTHYRLDSIRIAKEKRGVYYSKVIEVIVDTIFYGPNDKIVYLSIDKSTNKYAIIQNPYNKEGIDYDGYCYIGIKNSKNNSFNILKRLKYSVGSSDIGSYNTVRNSLRRRYLKKMNYIEGRYNINDTRFWNSNVWNKK